jgi:hypothetical protein
MNAKMMGIGFSKIANRGQETFQSGCDSRSDVNFRGYSHFSMALILATNLFAQVKSEAGSPDTGSDLPWEKA